MKTPTNRQSGFTLIELMIVVAIIGVLSAIAVPAYKNYVTKSELASGFATIKSTITPAELIVQSEGYLTASGGDILGAIGITSGANPLGELTATAAANASADPKGTIKFEFKQGGANTADFTYKRAENGWECTFTPGTSGLVAKDVAPKGCQ